MKCSQFETTIIVGIPLLVLVGICLILVASHISRLSREMNAIQESNLNIINLRFRVRNQEYTQNAQNSNLSQSLDVASSTTKFGSIDAVSQNSESINADAHTVTIVKRLWSFFKQCFELRTLIFEAANETFKDDDQIKDIQNYFPKLAKRYRDAQILYHILVLIFGVLLIIIICSCYYSR
ncbi:uncharacterized protein KGF55_004044 [Candida pseudojiufengensis]|uniref:uncharacterized protein n=1 Tax=Candida pseudojiufengensis TaxID=497109 RepID=UPI0022253E65|nr:uncharacterized protein KGF55_004044 [Candida pseudojiufengensis]KAI5961421.1 hypothetical protein KGF55_004044 [Candida pseudojiufengensis]